MAPKRLTHCCCFTVRTGSLILATFGFVVGLMGLGFYSFALDNDDRLFEMMDQAMAEIKQQYEQGQVSEDLVVFAERYIQLLKQILPPIFIAIIVLSCVLLVKNTLLMYGVLYKKRFAMMPWIVIRLVGIVINCFSTAGITICYASNVSLLYAVIIFAMSLPFIALDFYLWHCVVSHYKDLKEEEQKEDKRELVVEEIPPCYEYAVKY
jgi:hypothetical protein